MIGNISFMDTQYTVSSQGRSPVALASSSITARLGVSPTPWLPFSRLNTKFSSPPQSLPPGGPSAQNAPLSQSVLTHRAKPRSDGTTPNIFRVQGKSTTAGSHTVDGTWLSHTPCSPTWECCGVRTAVAGSWLVGKTSSPFLAPFPHPERTCAHLSVRIKAQARSLSSQPLPAGPGL